MAPQNDTPKISPDWPPSNNDGRTLTLSQRYRKSIGKSIYQKDKVVGKYEVRKGKWV